MTPFVEKSKGRILLHKPVPREKLLPHLSEMDFLVNLLIKGTETKQVPSKLIDYGLTGRPILNIDALCLDAILIDEFMKKNYTQSFKVENIQRYNIKNVSKQFLDLIQ